MKDACRICNNEFEYCHSCAITKDIFKNAGYCCENCYRISMILQKYGSKSMTAEETIKELDRYDVTNISLRQHIDSYYNDILKEIKPKRRAKIIEEVVPQEDVEVVVNKNEDMTISENE